ncbi:unnamed protein product [Cylicocyclus nassatus]|uniref:Prokaryotic-type class I peptide chain release factors domain-containing protein n=1 Tax=Cylicocyclus nassatus TaxID=53992 RepID=A0AA36MEH4_CYLNA|nr:unnamed protein product [Cylicocyclus nassatus]
MSFGDVHIKNLECKVPTQQMYFAIESPLYSISRRLPHLTSLASITQIASSSTGTKFNGVIPTESIEKRYSLRSGPGGQNVQKNATKVEIRFKLAEAEWLSPRNSKMFG